MDALPVELLCAISTRVCKKDLFACSSVSQLWRQITLPLLFRNLRISYSVQVGKEEILSRGSFLDETDSEDPVTLDWHRSKSHLLLPSFLAFLRHRPDIAASVRSLALTQSDEVSLAWDTTTSTHTETMLLVLNQLPSLANLELINVVVGGNHQPSRELVRHIDDLSIICPSADQISPESLMRLLGLFRSVSALSLIGIGIEETPPVMDNVSMAGWPLPQYAPKHLEIIYIDCPLKPLFSAMLLSRTLLQRVESLKMDEVECEDSDIDVFGRLIAQMSSSLVYFEAPDFLPEVLQDTLLVRLPKLETLHVRLRYHCYSDPARLLSTVRRNPNIRTVILEFQFPYAMPGKAKTMRQEAAQLITAWEDILLAWATTNSQNRVILVFDNDDEPHERDWPLFDEYVLHYADMFPRLREKGILKLKLNPDE